MKQVQFNQEGDQVLSYIMPYVEDDDWNGEYYAWKNAISALVRTSEDETPT